MKFFDLDGTLIDSNGVWMEVDGAFLTRRGLTVTPEYSDFVSHSIFPLAAEYTKQYYALSETPEAIMAEWLALAEDAYAHHIPLKEGARAYLEQCRAGGETLALVTASVPALCRAVLDRHGLTDLFSGLVFAQELGMEKRDPQVFLTAAARFGADPAACTMFEDSPAGCASAKAAGLTVVGVYDPFFASFEPEIRAVCDRYIHTFSELLN